MEKSTKFSSSASFTLRRSNFCQQISSINIICLLVITFSTILSSCKKFVQISPPPNEILTSQVFADSADATSAVLDLYISLNVSGRFPAAGNGDITIYTGLYSDELISTTGMPDDISCYTDNILATTNITAVLWTNFYQYLYEANLYGKIPLITTPDYKTNSIMPRTTLDSIYHQIVEDLESAQSLLNSNYPSTGKVRPNLFTATALLSKIYLYNQQWDSAEISSSQVIESGLYALDPNLNNVFLAESNEAIWQWIPIVPGYETSEGYTFVPTDPSIIPQYLISNILLESFENGDQRYTSWLDSNVVNGQVYYYPYKYKLGYDNNSTPIENYMVLRLAEQYLIRAEAEAELGNLSASAIDLNYIRNRAGLGNIIVSSKANLLTAIYHERQIELFCEWGNRWYDLKRTGQANLYMPSIASLKGGYWNSNKLMWPIPLYEISTNPFLVQNAGY